MLAIKSYTHTRKVFRLEPTLYTNKLMPFTLFPAVNFRSSRIP